MRLRTLEIISALGVGLGGIVTIAGVLGAFSDLPGLTNTAAVIYIASNIAYPNLYCERKRAEDNRTYS